MNEQDRPTLHVVAGSPTAEELAIVLALTSSRRATAAADAPHFSLWARKSCQTRPSLRPGFGAWRASMMPR
ncbi:MAG: acyl-CoA carboxylase subunit epsilon [Actinomycetota bacterium]|nr:acyl-CoA carboxylase subunit epsilon [Actinomycetota bacterium]